MIGPSVQAKETVEQIYSIRVHHETEGNVTLMNIKRTSTLRDIRAHLEVHNILQDRTFEFLRPDKSVVAPQDEAHERALAYIPVVCVRTLSEAEAEKASIIVCRFATGEEFLTTRVPVHYTFANLLDDAASFWDVPVECAVLKDAEGFSWAENISVLKLLRSSNRPSTIFLHEEYEPTASGRGGNAPQWVHRRQQRLHGSRGPTGEGPNQRARGTGEDTASETAGSVTAAGTLRLKARDQRTQRNPLLVSTQDTSPQRARRKHEKQLRSSHHHHHHHHHHQPEREYHRGVQPSADVFTPGRSQVRGGDLLVSRSGNRASFGDGAGVYDDNTPGGGGGEAQFDGDDGGDNDVNIDNKLFSIFTYHCVRGNSLHPDRMMFRQFSTFAKTCALLSPQLSQAHLQVIYSSILMEGKCLGVSNDKMHYHHFVKALVVIAQRLDVPGDDPAEQMLRLLEERVFPQADDWNLEVWNRYRDAVNTREVQALFKTLEPGLSLVFRYYAECQLHTAFHTVPMTYSNFWRMIADFELMTLKLSHQEVVGIYLAASSCGGIKIPKKSRPQGSSKRRGYEGSLSRFDDGGSDDGATEDSEGNNASGSESWTEMRFPHFLMFLAILGVHCYRHEGEASETPPAIHVKAIMYHLSRLMTPRRIATILDRRKHISTYPLFLSNGLRKIQDRVRKSWENDGRRDYITNTLPGRLAKKKIRPAKQWKMVTSKEFINWSDAAIDRQAAADMIENEFENAAGPIDLRAYLSTRPAERFSALTNRAFSPSPEQTKTSHRDGRPVWYPSPMSEERHNADRGVDHGGGGGSDSRDLQNQFDLMDDTLLSDYLEGDTNSPGPAGDPLFQSQLSLSDDLDLDGAVDDDDDDDPEDPENANGSPRRRQEGGGGRLSRSDSIEDIPESVFESSSADDAGDESDSSSSSSGSSSSDPRQPQKPVPVDSNVWANEDHSHQPSPRTLAQAVAAQNAAALAEDRAAAAAAQNALDSSSDSEDQGKPITQEQLAMLYRGHVFKKHGEQGSPNPRFVWLDSQHNCFRWCPPNKSADAMRAPPSERQNIPVERISHVQRGRTTAVFLRTSKKISTTALEDQPCFSLILKLAPPIVVPGAGGSQRRPSVTLTNAGKAKLSLDLQAESQAVRDQWANAIEALLKDDDLGANTKKSAPGVARMRSMPAPSRPVALPISSVPNNNNNPGARPATAPVSRNLDNNDFSRRGGSSSRQSSTPMMMTTTPFGNNDPDNDSVVWDGRTPQSRAPAPTRQRPSTSGERARMATQGSTKLKRHRTVSKDYPSFDV